MPSSSTARRLRSAPGERRSGVDTHRPLQSPRSAPAARALVAFLWLAGFSLAGLQAWAAITSYSMNADGVSYLDIADAYAAGDWSRAINSVWSPLYSWIFVVARSLAGPQTPEIVLVHLTNLCLFALAWIAFLFLKRELAQNARESARAGMRELPAWAWEALSHLGFFWATLCLITIWAVTPDLLMAVFVCLAAGLVIRIRRDRAGVLEYALLGLTLGAAYLAKSAMFPLAFAFLAAAWLSARSRRSALPRVALALTLFLAVSVPWIAAVSLHTGRVTFGEAGRLTYLRYVNGIPYPHWRGDVPGFGEAAHASRLVLAEPPVFEFGSPVGGTYPISYDPAYWYTGAETRFDLRRQANAIVRNAVVYHDLVVDALGGVLACVLLLLLLSREPSGGRAERIARWTLLVPFAAALSMYGLVYVEGRYIAIFLVLLLLESISRIRTRPGLPASLLPASCALMIAFLAGNLLAFHVRGHDAFTSNAMAGRAVDAAPPARPDEVVSALRQLGFAKGDGVGVIGYAFDSFWARAAGVRIVAELLGQDAGPLWVGDSETERRVLDAFARAGARAVVAEYVPPHVALEGWQRVARSNYFVKQIGPPNSGG